MRPAGGWFEPLPPNPRFNGDVPNGSPVQINTMIRLALTIAGLAGLGVIVHEVLLKWQLIGPRRGILWSILPLWALFVLKEISITRWFGEGLRLSPRVAAALAGAVNLLLIVLAVAAMISIPFLWFGIIEELAKGGGTPR